MTKYGIEESGFESQQDKRFVYSPKHSGAQPTPYSMHNGVLPHMAEVAGV